MEKGVAEVVGGAVLGCKEIVLLGEVDHGGRLFVQRFVEGIGLLQEGVWILGGLEISEVLDRPLPAFPGEGVPVGLHHPDLGEGPFLRHMLVAFYHAYILAPLSPNYKKDAKNIRKFKKIQ